MTDAEIIKALECCIPQNDVRPCEECPIKRGVHECKWCDTILLENALDLINRLKAEKGWLEELVSQNEGILPQYEQYLKSEAYKEFAERFENEFDQIEEFYFEEEHENFVSANKVLAFLDNLLKEMG